MRRESVATLRVRHLDGQWGLRGVPVKGGKIRDIPLPAAVMQFLGVYVEGMLTKQIEQSGRKRRCSGRAEGRRVVGKTRAPMTGKNVWRLCKVYGRISAPRNSSHTTCGTAWRWRCSSNNRPRAGRALLGHARIDTTQIYTSIRPPELKRAMSFYEQRASKMLSD
jgi:site-specific recombinase XerD